MRPSGRVLSLATRPLGARIPILPLVRPRPRILLTHPTPPRRILSLSLPRLFATQAPHSPPPSTPSSPDLAKSQTLTGRLKELIKSYGWYALGVYTVMTALDFSLAFILVQLLGRERVSEATHWLKEAVLSLIGRGGQGNEEIQAAVGAVTGANSQDAVAAPEGVLGDHEALMAMLALAYGIHKTIFLPFRIGLTAYITPRLVSWLRYRGWAGAAGTMRAAEAARARIRGGAKREA